MILRSRNVIRWQQHTSKKAVTSAKKKPKLKQDTSAPSENNTIDGSDANANDNGGTTSPSGKVPIVVAVDVVDGSTITSNGNIGTPSIDDDASQSDCDLTVQYPPPPHSPSDSIMSDSTPVGRESDSNTSVWNPSSDANVWYTSSHLSPTIM